MPRSHRPRLTAWKLSWHSAPCCWSSAKCREMRCAGRWSWAGATDCVRFAIPPRPYPYPRVLWPLADVVTPNLGEARALAGLPQGEPEALCRRLRELGCRDIIITLGGKGGVRQPRRGGGLSSAALPVHCVDSTGAGDNFNGALAARLAEGASLGEAVRYAAASSALSVTCRGVLQAIPTHSQVEAFLSKFPGRPGWGSKFERNPGAHRSGEPDRPL